MQNGLGGPDSADKRDWFAGVVVRDFPSLVPGVPKSEGYANEEADVEYVERRLLDVMLDEFEVNVDDESAYEVAQQVVRIRKDCIRGRFDEVARLQERWEASKGKKVDAMFHKGDDPDQDTDWDSESGSDEDEDEDGEDGDVQMNDAPPPREKTPPEVDEDGFIKVQRRKR